MATAIAKGDLSSKITVEGAQPMPSLTLRHASHITPRTAWLIEHHMEAHQIRDRTIGVDTFSLLGVRLITL